MNKVCTALILMLITFVLTNVVLCSADTSQDLNIPLEIFGPPWDINHDGTADFTDVSLLVNQYGNSSMVSGWIREDITSDGDIGLADVCILVNHYGEWWLVI